MGDLFSKPKNNEGSDISDSSQNNDLACFGGSITDFEKKIVII
jgi:hypothetical protein